MLAPKEIARVISRGGEGKQACGRGFRREKTLKKKVMALRRIETVAQYRVEDSSEPQKKGENKIQKVARAEPLSVPGMVWWGKSTARWPKRREKRIRSPRKRRQTEALTLKDALPNHAKEHLGPLGRRRGLLRIALRVHVLRKNLSAFLTNREGKDYETQSKLAGSDYMKKGHAVPCVALQEDKKERREATSRQDPAEADLNKAQRTRKRTHKESVLEVTEGKKTTRAPFALHKTGATKGVDGHVGVHLSIRRETLGHKRNGNLASREARKQKKGGACYRREKEEVSDCCSRLAAKRERRKGSRRGDTMCQLPHFEEEKRHPTPKCL